MVETEVEGAGKSAAKWQWIGKVPLMLILIECIKNAKRIHSSLYRKTTVDD